MSNYNRENHHEEHHETIESLRRLAKANEPCTRVHVDPDSQHLLDIIDRQRDLILDRDQGHAAYRLLERILALESQLHSLTEENERLRLLLDSWDDLENDWPGSFDAALTSWLFRLRELADATRALSPIDPPLGQEEKE